MRWGARGVRLLFPSVGEFSGVVLFLGSSGAYRLAAWYFFRPALEGQASVVRVYYPFTPALTHTSV